ncbi:hypothetical protein POL68_25475 [Stigmatella sp. ncwal1]|uniref:Secreted protein n=1 Tax=Stigmatella ashevillensis TaxID=2995309 RepID=A0ABT5DFA7_9BACT|nr:hypothetical protein [Stigmatella ashevillena]MDC0711845.1 hypothetical protein [Stigmatella ashevillena]
MRNPTLVSIVVAATLLFPLAGRAASWPAEKKKAYMDQCVQVATGQGVDAKTADKHCKCGADAIEKNFTAAEIEDLDSKDGVDPKLMQRAQSAVQKACTPK